MSYTIEDLSAVEKKITVHIQKEEVYIAIDTVMQQKQNETGKEMTPEDPVDQEKEDEILSLAANQIFNIRIKEAQKLYGIFPINRIQIQSEAPIEKGADFTFSFVAEVIPDLDIPDYKGFAVDVREPTVREEDIDQIIESLREQLSKLEPIQEDRPAADGDVAIFDFESLGDFKQMMGMSGENHALELGIGGTIEDFENLLKTLKVGESGTGGVAYPSEFPNPVLAGKEIETHVTLKGLNRKILPDIDTALAQKIAQVDTVIELRETIRKRHYHRLSNLYQQDARRKLLDDLIKKTDVPQAPTYIDRCLEDIIGNFTMAMQERGMTTTEISGLLIEQRPQFLPEAETAARRQIFLLAVAKKEQMKLDPQDLENEYSRQAEAAETDVNQFMLDAQQSGLVRIIKDDLMMRQVMDYLFEHADKTVVTS